MSGPSRRVIPFTKASACGNDFLIVAGADQYRDLNSLTRRLCDRHNGVGADGVEWLFPDTEADTRARLINADGSNAEISGNGTRCVAAEICSRTGKREIVTRTGAGLKTCHLVAKRPPTFDFEIEMGSATVEGQVAIKTESLDVVGTKVSMGNPHFVVFVDHFQQDWQMQAAMIQAAKIQTAKIQPANHQSEPHFPQGTNVEYVSVRGPHDIEIRLFERGVGETMSSGTGSCASAVAAIDSQRVTSPVTVTAPGGVQTVRWENQVYLLGPATLICRGEYFV
jgi:diaminopimelate epimerase